jgi:hypothetical protein
MIDNNRAVQFDQNVDQGQGEHNKTLPGIYPFWSSDTDVFDQVKTVDSMAGLGVIVPAMVGTQPGQNVWYLRTASDYMYKIRRLYFSAYELQGGVTYSTSQLLGGAFYYDISGDPQLAWNFPLTRYISLQFSVVSGGDRVIIGGNQLDQTSGVINAGQNAFTSVASLQSDAYGGESVFCPYLIPEESTLRFTLRNSFSSPLLVVGGLIGTRIRL